jgi:hypothetical protein
MAWYNASWSYRLPLTVTNGSSTSALSFCQVPVTISGSAYTSFHAHAKSDGSDIVVTDSDGVTALPFALELIDTTNSIVYLLVKLSLAANSSGTKYVYYGNALATSQSSYATTVGPTTAASLNADITTQSGGPNIITGYNSYPKVLCLRNQAGAHAPRNGTLLAFHLRNAGDNGAQDGKLGLLTCAAGSDPAVATNWTASLLSTPASGSAFDLLGAAELASGTVLVLYEYGTNTLVGGGKGGLYCAKSTDGGQTWTNLPSNAGTTPPANPMTQPATANPGTTAGEYYGNLVEVTPGGDMLATWYGYLGSDTATSVRLMKLPATSAGAPEVGSNWVDTGVTIARDGAQVQFYTEACLYQTSANHLVCVMRNDNPSAASGGGDLWVTRSTDGGATWAAPAQLGLPAIMAGGAVSPHLLGLQSGNLLLSWGNRNVSNSSLLGTYCALSTDGGTSFFDRSFAGSCEVSQGGAYRTDFGYPGAAQLADGRIVSLCYRGITADAATNIVSSVFTEDWVVNSPNLLETCQSLSAWLSVGANTALDATRTFAGQATAIKCSNNNSSAILARRPIFTVAAKTVSNFAMAAWEYPTAIASGSYLGHIVLDAAGTGTRLGLYATGSGTSPNITGELQYWNGSAYVNLSQALNLNLWNRLDVARLLTTSNTVAGQMLANTGSATSLGQYAAGGAPGQFELTAATGASVNTTIWLGLLYSHQYTPALSTLSVGAEQSAPVPSSGNMGARLLLVGIA